jgi:hypothetical protein
MGRMKELYMSIREANDGHLPSGLTMADAFEMHKTQIFNWEQYLKFTENENKESLQKESKQKKSDL